LNAPFDVYLDRKNAYQPDILFIATERMDLIHDNGLHGAPDLAIEILSPHTGRYDLEDKKEVYAEKGVKEYWIVEPHEKRATGHLLVDDEYHVFAEEVGVLNSKLFKKKFKF
jgi:Uma2 family endonuclease